MSETVIREVRQTSTYNAPPDACKNSRSLKTSGFSLGIHSGLFVSGLKRIDPSSSPFARFGIFPVGGRSTAVKMRNGNLWVLASTPLDTETKAKLEELGPVKSVSSSFASLCFCNYLGSSLARMLFITCSSVNCDLLFSVEIYRRGNR